MELEMLFFIPNPNIKKSKIRLNDLCLFLPLSRFATPEISPSLLTRVASQNSMCFIFNRPVKPGLFYKHMSLINLFGDSSFVEISSNNHNFQTVKARDLKFLHNVHHPLCHVSCVTCPVSHVK